MATAPGRVQIDFPHRRAGHCGSGALRDLLEFHGLSWGPAPLSEGIAFGLGAGLGFVYVELAHMDPPVYLIGRGPGLERDLCRHVSATAERVETDDPDVGWALLKARLDSGQPTMINADIRHLEYLRVQMQNTMHGIVVTGYDEAEAVAFIADNDRDEIQRCSLEALARARCSDGFPRPNRHSTWLIDFPAALPEPASAIRRCLDRTVANMRGGDESMGAPPEALGLAGVRRFAGAYPEWPSRFGDRLAAALRGLRVFIVKAGTGGAMFRSLHAGFLHESGRLLGDPGLADAARVYDQLSEAWIGLAAASGADSDPQAAHAAGVPHMERIGRLEHAGVEAMEAWLAEA